MISLDCSSFSVDAVLQVDAAAVLHAIRRLSRQSQA